MGTGTETVFVINSLLLGVGLAMDAFSVSLANGLGEPGMKTGKMSGIAGTFGFFQALMPLLGWICVHTIAQIFGWFEKCVPWIALLLLGYIGGKMIYEGLHHGACDGDGTTGRLGFVTLLVQGIATSIDALSVGFTISDYDVGHAVIAALIIALVTFIICMIGLEIGKKFGTKLAGKATLLGGFILVAIGIEIFLTGIL